MLKLFEFIDESKVSEKTVELKIKLRNLARDNRCAILACAQIRDMANGALKKLEKDTNVLLEQNFSDDAILPLTNRRAEGSFSTFKWNEKKFDNISKELLVNITISKVNNVSKFISEMVREFCLDN